MSVRKRAWQKSSGEKKEAWIADYIDQKGRRHIKTFDRKKEADAFLAKARFEVHEGTHTADSQSVTVDAAAALWLEGCETRGLEASTVAAYRQHVDLHIDPFLGRTKLSELTAPMIRELEDRLRRGDPAPWEGQGAPRSAPMIRKIMTSLSSLIADAQERGLVARNVVRDVRSRRKKGKERQAERRAKGKLKVGTDIPTPDEIKAILATASGRWRPFFLTATFTGLRASELRGLRWNDVDFKKSELHVCQRADRYNRIGPPKSESGERSIPLPPMVALTLREWKLACPKGDLDLVFPTRAGTIEHHTNIIKRGLVPVQIAAGVTTFVLDADGKLARDEQGRPMVAAKYTGLHALRHFFASWCINSRADGGLELLPKLVQERLGHATIAMTMDVYGHLFPRHDDSAELAAAEKLLLG